MKKILTLRCFHDPGERNREFGDSRLPHKDYARKIAEGEYGGKWHTEYFVYFPPEVFPDTLRGIPFTRTFFQPGFPQKLQVKVLAMVAAYG